MDAVRLYPLLFLFKIKHMKIAIVGGRDFNDYNFLRKEVGKFIYENEISLSSIISGGAKGADTLAEKLATEMNVELIIFKPNYEKFGRGATIVRNTEFIKNCDVVVAFWDGKSKGTHDSIKKAQKLDKRLSIINY